MNNELAQFLTERLLKGFIIKDPNGLSDVELLLESTLEQLLDEFDETYS